MGKTIAVLFVTVLGTSATAQPREGDRSAALYSTQIRFDGNVPALSIGIMDQQKTIRFSGKSGVTLLPDGPGGPRINTASSHPWTVSITQSKPAHLTWRVEVGSFAAGDLAGIQTARRQWKQRKVTVRPIERGSVFGFFGTVMDTRRVALARETVHQTRNAAEAAATALAAKYDVETSVVPVLQARARGLIQLTNGQTTVSAQDVFWIAPAKGQHVLTVHDVEYGRGFGWHGREDRDFRGVLYVTVDAQGTLAVASIVSAETMLAGIVPSEIFPSAPPEALKAQAIAARGDLLAKIGHRHLADPFVICSDVHCQAYRGTRRETPSTTAAVNATRGQMLFSKGGLVETYYSASCGGHTENNDNVWNQPPNPALRGVSDGEEDLGKPTEARVRAFVTRKTRSWCGQTRFGQKNFRWKQRVSVDRIRKGLKAIGHDVGVPRAITVTKRGVSGRATSVRIKGTLGRQTEIHGELVIRRAFGGLKSSLFVVDATPGRDDHPVNYHFVGAGFGHGVGMCQTGAIGMAEGGHSVKEILEHYYTGAAIQRIY